MDRDLVKKLLATLSISIKILTKSGNDPNEVCEEDSFAPNVSFALNEGAHHSLRKKLYVPFDVNELCIDAKRYFHLQVLKDQDRARRDPNIFIDATIIRVMKARKELRHNKLLHEVTSNVMMNLMMHYNYSGLSQIQEDLKARIAFLIERNFLRQGQDESILVVQ